MTSRTIYGLRQQVKQASEIGQYTLEEKIGSGGMGEVWRARHRMLIRPAAVKLVTAGRARLDQRRDPQLRLRRFEREARATAGLKSPHTVQLYDFGVTDDGTFYYVMELLDGMDLDTLVDRFGPLPASERSTCCVQVCASLDDAHENGLVHRDIKPANIFVSRIGADWDFVKVLDFGLVKLEGARQNDAELRRSRADNNVSGTPAFIAPEVVLGSRDRSPRRHLRARLRRLLAASPASWCSKGRARSRSCPTMCTPCRRRPPARSRSAPPRARRAHPRVPGEGPEQAPRERRALHARLRPSPSPPLGRASAPKQWWSSHAPAQRRPNAPSPTWCSRRKRGHQR